MTTSEFIPSVSRTRTSHLSASVKWVIGIVLGLIAIVAVWHLIEGWFSAKPKKTSAPPVTVARASSQTVTVMEHTIATVVSPATVQVNAQVAGKLLTATFQEGQIVHKGDALFLIDPTPYRNALDQAKAQLAKDQAAATSAGNDEKRYIALYAQGAASQQQRDQAVATAAGDRAAVQSDQAAAATAEVNLGYTRIVSPIDGKTGPITVQPGNLVTVAGTTLVTITQIQPIKLSFFLPQSELDQIQDQMEAGKLIATVPMPGAPGGAEKAPVNFISNIVSASTGTIELRATFPNTDLRLVPGQTVNIALALKEIPHAVMVPRDAVNTGPDGAYVEIVTKDSIAVSKPVSVLNDDGTFDAIKGDVKPGDAVITEGQIRVVPGGKVTMSKGKRGAKPALTSGDMPT